MKQPTWLKKLRQTKLWHKITDRVEEPTPEIAKADNLAGMTNPNSVSSPLNRTTRPF